MANSSPADQRLPRPSLILSIFCSWRTWARRWHMRLSAKWTQSHWCSKRIN